LIASAAVGILLILLVVAPHLDGAAHADTTTVEHAKEMGLAFAEVAKNASPAVVFIRTEKSVTMNPAGSTNPFEGDLLRRFFGHGFATPPLERHVEGQGSGFIVSADGYILTNNHVVEGADEVKVKLADDRELDAEIVGTDPHTDVAVIRVDAKNLPTLELGDSDDLHVGEWVLALGNPFGLSNTLTAGIVSAKGRSRIGLADYEDFIQTDAAINPGNSGGPLIDLDGRVVGINTAIATRSGGYMGVGFAIPINLAQEISRQIRDHGSVTRGYLGIVIQDLTPELATSLEIDEARGILVSDVEEGSPAADAGLRRGDVVLEIDGRPVEKMESFRNRVALTEPGTTIRLDVLRDGKRRELTVSVGTRSEDSGSGALSSSSAHDLGLVLEDLSGDVARQLGFVGRHGVVITDVVEGSSAARAGLHPGMLIEQVDRQEIESVTDFRRVLDASTADKVLLLVRDEQAARFLVLQR
jgi:serine protease Do